MLRTKSINVTDDENVLVDGKDCKLCNFDYETVIIMNSHMMCQHNFTMCHKFVSSIELWDNIETMCPKGSSIACPQYCVDGEFVAEIIFNKKRNKIIITSSKTENMCNLACLGLARKTTKKTLRMAIARCKMFFTLTLS